jgi:uncharacterized protein YqeY
MSDAPTYLRLKDDMKTAMKARAKDRLLTIRMLISSLNNAKIELQRDLTEDDILGVFSTEAKKRRESSKAYRDGDRPELADKEDAELLIISEYLPEQLSDEEVGAIVEAVIADVGATSKRDMGKVMGKVIAQVKGRFDGGRVKDIVLSKLP